MPDGVINVILADDHAVVRSGVRQFLASARDIRVIAEASDGQEAVALTSRLHPDVLVMDVSMGGMDGITAAAQVHEQTPDTRVLMLTMHAEEEYLTAALRAGAAGYLVKSAADRELVDAVRAIAYGDVYVQPSAARVLARRVQRTERSADDRTRLEKLSDREREVLRLVAEGYGAPEIARQLGISAKTVDTYRQRVSEKTGFSGRPDFVRFALRVGLLSPDGDRSN
ncbi:MAG TPA: response regulator transcription factor [Gemmatimonadaceae bacterium]|nr:response regulator transcription factor [Gemmatimonadaceae bacterium]